MKHKRRFVHKVIALFLAHIILAQTLFPTLAYALTAGPASPDFASFEPVATTDMVNVFSGDFTYNLPAINIPGPEGSGYALSLSYHSGGNAEDEASWVGHGWTLNPGAINRNVRGLPDDYDGAIIKRYNKTLPNWTVTAYNKVALELYSKSDLKLAQDIEEGPQSSFPSVDLSQTLRYNNYMGFNRMYGMAVGYKGSLSLGANFGASGITFSAMVNVGGILMRQIENSKRKKLAALKRGTQEGNVANNEAKSVKQKTMDYSRQMKTLKKRIVGGAMSNASVSSYGLAAFEGFGMSPVVQDYKGFGCNFNTSQQLNMSQMPVGIETAQHGSVRVQYNVPVTDFQAYGYANNLNKNDFSDDNTVNKLNDYYVEKAGVFDQRDLFLGIPFANYDIYGLSGEGLSGSFRSFNLSTGHYYPNFVASDITTVNTGVELMIGANIGIGLNFGIGNTKTRVKDWGNRGNTGTRQYDKDAGSVYRFNHDMGGKVEYSGRTDVENARLVVDPDIPMIRGALPSISEDNIYSYLNNATSGDSADRATGRSSYITEKKSGNTTTGFAITKEDGTCYHYDVPVYTKNMVQVSVDVNPDHHSTENYKFVYRNAPISSSGFDEDFMNQYQTVVGEARLGDQAKYATAYLLRYITTADYIDLTGNGPSDDDFGGWTRFEYDRIHEDYRWRIPYQGLNYSANLLSDKNDDLGSVSTGEKEVYLLRKIVTKTHTAYFMTNQSNGGYESKKYKPSNNTRKDGVSASTLTDSKTAKGAHQLEYLEKIILVANSRKEIPLKTVHFNYTYELAKNLPNNLETGTSSSETGKLTLKKVWFEYEGIVNARISPYEFFYQYKDSKDFKPALKQKYPLLADFFELSNTYSDAAQNPDYSPYAQDAWGRHQPLGREQAQKIRPWRYQGALPEGYQYESAAYQLKQIRLPSGGEILVEYEEKDYRYVQDREVMAMVSIADFDDDKNGLLGDQKYKKNPWYKLNLQDVGLEATQELADRMNEYFVQEENRIYFKFLFQLVSDDLPSLSDCRSEYIDGYVKVDTVILDGTDIKITLNGDGSTYDGDDKNYPMTPRQACYDFYSTHRVGKYDDPDMLCENSMDSYNSKVTDLAYKDDPTTLSSVWGFIQKMGFSVEMIFRVHDEITNMKLQPPIKAKVCRQMNTELSYLKIPLTKAKKGGGCRVKRLLTYDPGIEAGEDGVVYGSRYRYEHEDGLSSGVATNEPTDMREENPMVGFIPKKNQTWLSRHTVGRDKEQTEGPIGESLLPAASVGYSRVVIESVHQGKSSNGFVIHNYHTVKEYPYDKTYNYQTASDGSNRKFDFTESLGVEYSDLHNNMAKDKAPINAGIFSYNSQKFWATQGFRFIQTAMHGQPASIEKYSGTYQQYQQNRNKVLMAYAQYFNYFEPGEQLRMLRKKTDGGVEVYYDNPGKEMDIAMEMKSVKERSMDFLLEVDISIGLSAPPPPFITLMGVFDFAENILSLHSTSKVISYPVIQKSTRVYQDGVWAETEYLAFDQATGKPLLSRTSDIYDGATPFCVNLDGSVYSMLLPAYWYYPEMGQMAEVDLSQHYRSNQLAHGAGTIISYGSQGNPIQTDSLGDEYFQIPLQGILNAQVQTYSRGIDQTEWFDDAVSIDYGLNNPNTVKEKLNKLYRPWSQYVYKTDISSLDEVPVYEAGIYKNFELFDYSTTKQTSTSWIKTNEVTRYSPDGFALEEKDVLGIPSAVRFGYSHTLPVIAGANCEYSTIYFEDYENDEKATVLYAHSGARSQRLSAATTSIVPSISLTDSLRNQGAFVRLWLKSDTPVEKTLRAGIQGGVSVPGFKVASSGAWSLYHFEFTPSILTNVSSGSASIDLIYPLTGQEIYIDDVRFQPMEAEATCFVYDPASLRLLVRFDDQHFGRYYQYSAEGKLIRELVETERGIKTLREAYYHTPTKER
jgi:hypothetical protein